LILLFLFQYGQINLNLVFTERQDNKGGTKSYLIDKIVKESNRGRIAEK